MTPELQIAIESAVKKTVNGQIKDFRDENKKLMDAMRVQIETHVAEVKPFMQGAAGIQILWKLCVAIGSLAGAYLAVKGIFTK